MSYLPGETCPQTGLFRVVHETHRPAHQVLVELSRTFPACRWCGEKVRFEFVAALRFLRTIPPRVENDRDFWGDKAVARAQPSTSG